MFDLSYQAITMFTLQGYLDKIEPRHYIKLAFHNLKSIFLKEVRFRHSLQASLFSLIYLWSDYGWNAQSPVQLAGLVYVTGMFLFQRNGLLFLLERIWNQHFRIACYYRSKVFTIKTKHPRYIWAVSFNSL